MKSSGLIDMTWTELAEILNKELREDPTEYYSESAYRKRYNLFAQFKEEFGNPTESADAEELRELKEEIQKEKKKLFDQRREYNKLLAFDARAEHLTDCMIRVANEMNSNYPLLSFSEKEWKHNCEREAIACFSDWHLGMVTDNIWNTYNVNICKERVAKCVDYMCLYLQENNVHLLHIALLGDFCHGAIHTTSRIKSEEDTCDQLMMVSEILAQAISKLSEVVDTIIIHSCYGNHMRTIQNKSESIHSDNMEKIIPWWLEQRLANNIKVSVEYTEFKEFTCFDVFDYHICCVHGDLMDFKKIGTNANMLFTKLIGKSVDYTISGDKHHLEEYGQYGIESILVRSLCGSDDYASEKQLYDKPGQTLIIFNSEYGRECTYHIPLGDDYAKRL